MKSFKRYIAEAVSATDMEKHIVVAFNGGFDNAPDTYGLKREVYEASKHISETIAKDIRKKTGASEGSMIHFGSGKGSMISWWQGNPTPKTDLYSTDGINISLKQKGGSQLMSGLRGETLSTFKAATIQMKDKAPSEINTLVSELEKVLKKVVVPGNINTMSQVIKGKLPIPKSLTAKKSSGKEITININKKEYEKSMKEVIDWKAKMKEIQPVFQKFFETNDQYKLLFCHEAATGNIKFAPDKYANSNWVVEFDPKNGTNNTIEPLSEGSNPSAFMKKLSKKATIRISPKTPTGSKVSATGTAATSGSLRLDIKENNNTLRLGTKENIYTLIDEEISTFVNNQILNEEVITEIKLFAAIKDWFKNLLNKLFAKIKELAKKGLEYVSEFFEFQPADIKTSGLELFGY